MKRWVPGARTSVSIETDGFGSIVLGRYYRGELQYYSVAYNNVKDALAAYYNGTVKWQKHT